MGVNVVDSGVSRQVIGRESLARRIGGGKWVSVPKELIIDKSLSAAARLTLIWVASQPENFNFYISKLKSELGFGDSAWLSVRKQLIEKKWFYQTKHFGTYSNVFDFTNFGN